MEHISGVVNRKGHYPLGRCVPSNLFFDNIMNYVEFLNIIITNILTL